MASTCRRVKNDAAGLNSALTRLIEFSIQFTLIRVHSVTLKDSPWAHHSGSYDEVCWPSYGVSDSDVGALNTLFESSAIQFLFILVKARLTILCLSYNSGYSEYSGHYYSKQQFNYLMAVNLLISTSSPATCLGRHCYFCCIKTFFVEFCRKSAMPKLLYGTSSESYIL